MFSPLARAARPLSVAILFLVSLFALPARADLVWSPGSGWTVEGGALSGLIGEDANNALELMNRAREAEERGNLRSAMRAYDRVSKRYVNSIYGPEAVYRLARLRLANRQYFKAFDAFQIIVSRYPNTERFNEVIGEQYRIASALMDGARNRTWGWLPGFRNRDQAILYFEQIIINAPYSDYAPLALMNIARAHQRLGNDFEAIDALDRMINFYPQSILAPDAYLKLAETHASLVDGPEYDQASTREAITYFEDFIILFPSDTNVADAERGLGSMKEVLAESKMTIAEFYFHKRSNFRAARVFYNEAITAFPDSAVAERAREELAKIDAAEAERAARAQGAADSTAPRRKFLGLF
jgi:outer membrane protein assembly factor BamD